MFRCCSYPGARADTSSSTRRATKSANTNQRCAWSTRHGTEGNRPGTGWQAVTTPQRAGRRSTEISVRPHRATRSSPSGVRQAAERGPAPWPAGQQHRYPQTPDCQEGNSRSYAPLHHEGGRPCFGRTRPSRSAVCAKRPGSSRIGQLAARGLTSCGLRSFRPSRRCAGRGTPCARGMVRSQTTIFGSFAYPVDFPSRLMPFGSRQVAG